MPTLNPDLERISETIKGILDQKANFELLVIFQKSPDNTVQAISEKFKNDPRLLLIKDKEVGISNGRNLGIEKSSGSWFLFFDDDIKIPENLLKSLNLQLDKGQDKFFYGNLLESNSQKNYLKFAVKDKPLTFFSYNRVCSVILVLNRDVFESIGRFDTQLGSGKYCGACEESDLVIRALKKGFKISYLKDFIVFHDPANHSVEKFRKYFRGHGAIFKKYFVKGGPILSLKLIIDLVLRIFLLLTLQTKRFIYFPAFIQGWKRYNSSESGAKNSSLPTGI